MGLRGFGGSGNIPRYMDLLCCYLRVFIWILLGWIPALILALVVAVAMIYLWPLAAVVLLYAIYRVLGVHPHLLNYIAVLIAICAIAIVWWWHMVRHNNML